ncbi:MAG: hypothetical protein WBY47_10860, partial [Desulfobacterales bacterium]
LQNAAFCPISASGSNLNPQNTNCIPAVKIFAFLELEQKSAFCKGLAPYIPGSPFRVQGCRCIRHVDITEP